MKKYSIIIFVTVLCITVSCSKELDITPPNRIVTEQVMDLLMNGTDAQRENIFLGMAASLPVFITQPLRNAGVLDPRHYHYSGMAVMRGFEGNDMIFGNNTAEALPQCFGREEYRWNSIRNATGTTGMYWQHGYDMVAAANKILAYLPNEVVGANATLKKYRAQALFLRAFGYNHLVENFQDAYTQGGNGKLGVPVYETFNPAQPYRERETLDKCYQFIVSDLNQAIQDFGEGYFTVDVKNDLDAGVAYFLRARVAICMGNWAQAAADCQKIIAEYGESFMNQDQYVAQKQSVLVDDNNDTYVDHYFAIRSGFLNMAENPETIWGFNYTDASAHSQSTWLNVFATNTQQGGARGLNVQIDQRLYDKIADGDYRKENFVDEGFRYTYADNISQNILPYANLKFASTVGKTVAATTPGAEVQTSARTTGNQNDWTLFRLSEVYLMLAEAQAQANNENAAKATLDLLIEARTNGTFNTDTYPAHAGLSMLDRIKLQTRIEMWGERGLEFYNNKRWNIPVDRNGSSNHWDKVPITVKDMTMQIPELSINLNGLLEQNP